MENKSLEITNDIPTSLLLLPSELLTKIMLFAMARDIPVFFWLFRNLTRFYCFHDLLNQRGDIRTFFPDPTFLQSQQQHLLDWVSVTGTCRRLREYGIPAFFREKSFVVPLGMLRDILDGIIRSSVLDMAMDWIRKVEIPVNPVINGIDFMFLPKYHRFTGLTVVTLRVLDSRDLILSDARPERPFP